MCCVGVGDCWKSLKKVTIESSLLAEFYSLLKLLPLPLDLRGKLEVQYQTACFPIGFACRQRVFDRLMVVFEGLSGFIRAHSDLIRQVEADGRIKDTKMLETVVSMAKREYTHWAKQFPGVAGVHRTFVSARHLAFEKAGDHPASIRERPAHRRGRRQHEGSPERNHRQSAGAARVVASRQQRREVLGDGNGCSWSQGAGPSDAGGARAPRPPNRALP